LKDYPVNQTATPCMSSWGYKGFNEVWLNGRNDWIYPHLHAAGSMIDDMADRYAQATGPARRALNQAARELLLAQASDWPFMLNSGNMGDYPTRRIKSHLGHFHQLKQQVENAAVDNDWLERVENENDIFSQIETFAAFRAHGVVPLTVVQTAVSEDESGNRRRAAE